MGVWCAVLFCRSNSFRNPNLRFHRFPRDDRCEKWMCACGRPELKVKTLSQLNNMYVCSLHFEDWMYLHDQKKLIATAVPVLNLPPNAPKTTVKQTVFPKINLADYITDIDAPLTTSNSAPTLKKKKKQVFSKVIRSNKNEELRKKKFRVLPETRPLNWKKLKSVRINRKRFLQGCDSFLSPNLSKIMKIQDKLKPHTKNTRYTKEFQLFCLNIYLSNPGGYRFTSKTLRLPPKRILATFAIPTGTNVSEYIWGLLSHTVKQLSPTERECTLCIGAMKLKRSLFYDAQRDKIMGLHEIDDIQSMDVAGFAFTVMLRGVLSEWNQVVGYAFTKTNKIDESLQEWIINTIQVLLEVGFKIRAVVSDHGSDFTKFAKKLGVSKEIPYFEVAYRKIYYLFDIPHLIKTVRNNLMDYDFEFNSKRASWDDIKSCYELDKHEVERHAPRLTDAHISPKRFQKKKLRLVVQVFSNSVKEALETYAEAGDLTPCDGTAELIETMDQLFDVFNANSLVSKTNEPFRESKSQIIVLLKAHNLLNSLKMIQNSGGKVIETMKFVDALAVTLNAIIPLYDDLKSENGLEDLPLQTRRLNNESLEQFFDIQRRAAGDRKPTCTQFEKAFRKTFLCQTFKLSIDATSYDDFDSFLTRFSNFAQNNSIFTPARPNRDKFEIPEKNSFVFICGNVWQRCVKIHSCLRSKSTKTNEPQKDIYKNNNLILQPTSLALPVPPTNVSIYLNDLENHYKRNFLTYIGDEILKDLSSLLMNVKIKKEPCSCFPYSLAVKSFIRMRTQHLINQNNRKLEKSKKVHHLELL